MNRPNLHIRPRAHRPLRGLRAVAMLLACVVLLGGSLSNTAFAQSQGGAGQVQLDLSAGFGDSGAYLIGEWVPVRVTLTNPPGGAARRVRVEVEAYGGDDRSVIGLFNLEVDLPGQSRKELTLYTYTGSYSRTFRVYVREGNNLLVTRSASVTPYEPPVNMIVGVASSDSSLLNGLASEKVGHIVSSIAPGMGQYGYTGPTQGGQGATAVVAHISLDHMPPTYQGWKALGALLLDDSDAAALSREQRAALETWVAEGGTLIVAWRPGGSNSTGALSPLLPVTVSGSRSVDSLDALTAYISHVAPSPGRVEVGNAVLAPDAAESSRVLAMQDGNVLLAARDLGRGRVIYMGVSPALPPLKSWDGTLPLVKKLLADTPVRPTYGAYMRFGPMRGVYMGSVYGASGAMFAMPGLELPNSWLVGAFLLVYILIIGPINFIVLRRMRRAELAWITVPALVGLFSVGAYLLAYQAKGGEVVAIRASTVTTYEGLPYGTTVQNYGLFSPVRRTYRLSMPAEATVTELNAYGYYQAGSDNPATVYGGGTTVVDNVLINTWSLKAFMAEHSSRVEPPLEADLRLDNNMIVGTVRNRLTVPLQDVALLRGDASAYIGFVAAGGSAEVRLPLSSRMFNSASPTALLPTPPGVTAPQPGYGYPYYGSEMSAEQRSYNRKIELMSAGLYPYIGDLPPLDMRVTMLAWGPSAPDPITVDRYTTQQDEANLWVSQAAVRVAGRAEQPITPGSVPYTVYAPGNTIPWLAWAGTHAINTQLAPGQAFPQPVPSAPGQAFPGPVPTVSPQVLAGRLSLEPYADIIYSFPAGTVARTLRLDYSFNAQSLSPLEVQIYNTRTGAWDALGTIGGGGERTDIQMPVSDAAPYVGSAGDLVVRISPGNSDNGSASLVNPVFNIAVNPDEQR